MQVQLVVVRAFGAFAKGDIISDTDMVAMVLASENAGCVVRVMAQGG